jgi:hypothetical protein
MTDKEIIQTVISMAEKTNDHVIVLSLKIDKMRQVMKKAVKMIETGRIQAALDMIKKELRDDIK